MKRLNIDVETYSSVDIKQGLSAYIGAEDFEVLLLAYSYDGYEVDVLDLASGDQIPLWLEEFITKGGAQNTAFNASFERLCLSRHFGVELQPKDWHCTMVHSWMAGYSGGLGSVANAMQIDERKDKGGTALINYFSKPCKPTKANGMRHRNLPHHDPDKWALFIEYCRQDVVVEMAILKEVQFYKIPDFERELWILDQKINDFGIGIDMDFVKNIVEFDKTYQEGLMEQAKYLTGLDNPNSVAQLLGWLLLKGYEMTGLAKAQVEHALSNYIEDMDVRTMLELRQSMSKTSNKKYHTMASATTSDNRIHNTLQYYGAATGRWAGRLVQVQNLPRNYIGELDEVRDLILNGDFEVLEMIYDSDISDILSQMIRTSFIPSKGKTFVISDYSAIEARVIAWLAKETWLEEVFAGDGKVYEATASRMLDKPLSDISPADRDRGKVATLALGYQGGTAALEAMGALNMGIPVEDLPGIVRSWRKANKNITTLWRAVNGCARAAIATREPQLLYEDGPVLEFGMDGNHLYIQLPSGRRLIYLDAQLVNGAMGPKVTFMGLGTYNRKWARQDTYGGKLVENIVQAIARDLLACALLELDRKYDIAFHVHDEIVVEVPNEDVNEHMARVTDIMGLVPKWGAGLIIPAEAFASPYYKKD